MGNDSFRPESTQPLREPREHRRGTVLSAPGRAPRCRQETTFHPSSTPDGRVASGDLLKCFLSSLCINESQGDSTWQTAHSRCG